MPPPPGPRDRFFGLVLAERMRRDRLGTLIQLARDYGDVVGFRVGRQPFALLNHPDHVEDVLITRARSFKKGRALERAKRVLGKGLLTSEAETHLRQRRLVQPAFHKRANRRLRRGDDRARAADGGTLARRGRAGHLRAK